MRNCEKSKKHCHVRVTCSIRFWFNGFICNWCSCQWSDFIQEYVDFDTEEEAKMSGIDYVKCQDCFGEE